MTDSALPAHLEEPEVVRERPDDLVVDGQVLKRVKRKPSPRQRAIERREAERKAAPGPGGDDHSGTTDAPPHAGDRTLFDRAPPSGDEKPETEGALAASDTRPAVTDASEAPLEDGDLDLLHEAPLEAGDNLDALPESDSASGALPEDSDENDSAGAPAAGDERVTNSQGAPAAGDGRLTRSQGALASPSDKSAGRARRARPEVATSDRVYTARDTEPHPEEDPERRDGMTIGAILPEDGTEFPDTAGRGPPATLTDACALYPLGQGTHFIRLERLKPVMHQNIPTAGYLGDIRHPMSEREFQRRYGGGVYKLIVYGPDPRGREDPVTGAVIIKALTRPFSITVPGYPNPHSLLGGEEERERMFGGPSAWDRRPGGIPPTSAEASMHRDALQVTERVATEERREKREAQQKLEAARESGTAAVVSAVRETAKDSQETMREQLRLERERADRERESREAEIKELRREVLALRDKPSETSGAWDAMSKMAGVLAPGSRSTEELSRIHESHRAEINRLNDTHRVALEELRRTYDDRVKAVGEQLESERRRARDEMKDLTDRFERRERDQRDLFEQRMKDKEASFDRQLTDLRESHRNEVARVEKENERRVHDAERSHDLVKATEKQALELQIVQLKERIALLKDEVGKARADADKKGNLGEQIAEVTQMAEVLGLKKTEEEGPKDWKMMVAEGVMKALQNVDKVVDAYARNRQTKLQETALQVHVQQAQQQAQQQRAAAGPPEPPRRELRGPGGQPLRAQRVWGTEGLEMAPNTRATNTVTSTPPLGPDVRPSAADAPPAAAAAPAPAPVQAPAPAAPPAPAPVQAPAQPLPTDILETFRIWAEGEIEQGSDPLEFGRNVVRRAGPARALAVLEGAKLDDLMAALASSPETAGSPILTRAGQAFMRTAWEEAKEFARAEIARQ